MTPRLSVRHFSYGNVSQWRCVRDDAFECSHIIVDTSNACDALHETEDSTLLYLASVIFVTEMYDAASVTVRSNVLL